MEFETQGTAAGREWDICEQEMGYVSTERRYEVEK